MPNFVESSRYVQEDSIKIDLREIGYEDVEWIYPTQDED
jgi:hypothetical protein